MTSPILARQNLRYPVGAYFLAVRRKDKPQLPEPAESFVAMTRRNYRVVLHELTSSQYSFLEALDGHHIVGEALNSEFRSTRSIEKLTETVRGWLCDWVNAGFFSSVAVQQSRTPG